MLIFLREERPCEMAQVQHNKLSDNMCGVVLYFVSGSPRYNNIMGLGGSQPKLTEDQQKKLDSGKPILLPGGIKILKNKDTGLLEGVPEEWANNYELPFNIDYKKLGSTKEMPETVRAEEELPEGILSLINTIPMSFSL